MSIVGSKGNAPRVGILGGSFDPVHNGHLLIAREARRQLALARVLLAPAFAPPHKGSALFADARDRLEMVRLAVEPIEGLCASDVEASRGTVSYSIDTVRVLRAQLGEEVELFFVIGSDTIGELPTWRNIRELARLCTFAAVRRPGWAMDEIAVLRGVIDDNSIQAMKDSLVQVEGVDISSTQIRRMISRDEAVDRLVPAAVAGYIRARGLYR